MKLKAKHVEIEFPKKICPAVAVITDGFSFAYMQEAFVATLLAIAQRRSDTLDVEMEKTEESGNDDGEDGDKDLDDYELWRELKKTIKALRDDMGNTPDKSSIADDPFSEALALEKKAQAPAAGVDPPLAGQDQPMNPLRPVDNKPGKRHDGTRRVQGMVLEVDHQHVPIITDENKFVYHSE